MEIIAYSDGVLPKQAEQIRQEVFVEEQGFQDEFDEADGVSTHFLAFLDGVAVGTCRTYFQAETGRHLIGRLAVKRAFRGNKIGAELIKAAQTFLKEREVKEVYLHAQTRAKLFYQKQGFIPFGEEDEDEGCAHIWMKKELL